MVGTLVIMLLHARVTSTTCALHRLLHTLQLELLVVWDPDALILRIVLVYTTHLRSTAHGRKLDASVVVRILNKALMLDHEISRTFFVPAMTSESVRMLVIMVIN